MRSLVQLDFGPVVRTLRRQPMVLALVVLEIAAGVATISGLLMSGYWYGRIAERPSGLDEENLILVSTYTPGSLGPGRDDAAVERSVRDQQGADRRRLRALPGVEAVAGISTSVLDDRWSFPTLFAGRPAGATSPPVRAVGWIVYTDPELLMATGLRLLSGAAPQDAPSPAGAALVTRSLAESVFGTTAVPPGSTIASEQNAPVTVLGVMEDVRMRMPFMPNGRAVAFLFGAAPFDHEARLLVRVQPGRRDAVLAHARAAFALDATSRSVEVRTFDSGHSVHYRIGNGLWRMLRVFGVILGIVVLLGALASTSFLVAQRTRQIGIRRALGATRADIVGLFLLESMVSTTVGSVLGVAGSFVIYRLMQRVFAEITFDLGLMAMTLGLLWFASILATLIPALRAARVPPGVASRSA